MTNTTGRDNPIQVMTLIAMQRIRRDMPAYDTADQALYLAARKRYLELCRWAERRWGADTMQRLLNRSRPA